MITGGGVGNWEGMGRGVGEGLTGHPWGRDRDFGGIGESERLAVAV